MRKCLPMILLSCVAAPAAAQDWNNLAVSEAMNQVHASMRQNMIVNPAEEESGRTAPGTTGVTRIDPAYRVDPSVRRGVQQRLVAAVATKDKAASEELEATFARHDLIAMADRALGALGLRSGNVIDAVTIYRLAMWGAAKGLTTPPPRATTVGARHQVASTFNLSGAGLDTAERRQQFAETLLYQAILVDLASEDAQKRNDQVALTALRSAARKAMVDSGIEPDRTQLTAQGFVPVR